MTTQETNATRMHDAALFCALGLGVLADLLIRVDGRPGINVSLWAMAGVAALWWLSRRRREAISRETQILVGTALLFAFLLPLRDAESLAVFALFAAVVSLGLAAGHAAGAWATRASVFELAVAAARVGVFLALGPFGWSVGRARVPRAQGSATSRHARTVVRGTVLAIPPLLVLAGLLTSADPVFEHVIRSTFIEGFGPLLEHVLFAVVIAWLTSGFLRAFFVDDKVLLAPTQLPRPSLATSEVAFAVSLLNILLLAFLVVQVRYLFGGADLVQVTPGLSYADYARRGFFELLAAAVFVVPVLLVADWAAVQDEERGRKVLHATSLLLVLLLMGVLASAAYRMKLYVGAYGLTEDRVIGSMVMVWVTVVLLWLAFTVLRGRRRRFVFGAIVAGLVCLAGMHAVNPHALIARVNIARAQAGKTYDGAYISRLSADAVPTLVAKLPVLPPAEQCRVLKHLSERWSGERSGGWRTWNWSDARARAQVDQLRVPAACTQG